jgi:hypothetical protein
MKNLMIRLGLAALFWSAIIGFGYGLFLMHPSLAWLYGAACTFLMALGIGFWFQEKRKKEEKERLRKIKEEIRANFNWSM